MQVALSLVAKECSFKFNTSSVEFSLSRACGSPLRFKCYNLPLNMLGTIYYNFSVWYIWDTHCVNLENLTWKSRNAVCKLFHLHIKNLILFLLFLFFSHLRLHLLLCGTTSLQIRLHAETCCRSWESKFLAWLLKYCLKSMQQWY